MKKTIRLLIKKPEDINREVRAIISSMFPAFDFSVYDKAFVDAGKLFSGQMQYFERCDTLYHDWQHTLGVLLATARLLHGVHLDRLELSERIVNLALVAALFHDAGYIRRSNESTGTGGQFTQIHVQRGIDLLEEYADTHEWPVNDIMDMECMLMCTDPARNPDTIVYTNIEAMLAAHVLATADITAQMADDIYLEKLPFLFLEFMEAGVTDFTSEYDLFIKTRGFHSFARTKIEGRLSNVIACMPSHFRERHGIEMDLYSEAVQRNMNYLGTIMEELGKQYRNGLRRSLDRDEFLSEVAA
jgi:hypothetical protein